MRADPEAIERFGTRAALIAALSLPVLVILSRSAAEAVFAALAVGFLLRLWRRRESAALRAPWFLAACAYWAWLVLATFAASADVERVLVALAWGRFPLVMLALSSWLLVSEEARRWALRISGTAALAVAVETWAQFLFGRGLTGTGRAVPGYLSGPFRRPRVGGFLLLVMWPALFAAVARLRRAGAGGVVAAALLIAVALGAVLLGGQRVPAAGALVVLLLGAWLLPALRLPVAVGLVPVLAMAAAAPILAPEAFARYAQEFPRLLLGFAESHYGLILARALAIFAASPWVGHGAEAFRHLCRDPAFFRGWGGAGEGGGAAICVTHPHNHYLEALTDGGVIGLLLFAFFQGLFALAILRGALAAPRDAVRIGLVLPLLLGLWPLQTASAFAGIESAAPRCLLAGWALAAAAAARRPATSSA